MKTSYPLPAALLPHAYPFILIDKIIEFEEGKRIICVKNVSINEEFFNGRFIENPMMPEVLIVEAMAQAAGLIIGGKRSAAYLSRVNEARFIKPVIPGDRLFIKASVIQKFHPLYVFETTAFVMDELRAEAEITLSVMEQ
jgi:3-hydroxyacyl-[acyl-carrier-protein] dehydratase/UDP-3-O-[3-hydroxymyristoyl] N-acetylglucosamine deacetylase/3-hydroxyacyl-[acyl-carrier-protein] dehydratase